MSGHRVHHGRYVLHPENVGLPPREGGYDALCCFNSEGGRFTVVLDHRTGDAMALEEQLLPEEYNAQGRAVVLWTGDGWIERLPAPVPGDWRPGFQP